MAFAPAFANKGKAKVFSAWVNEDVEDHEMIEGIIYLKRNNVHIIDDNNVCIPFDTRYTYSFTSLDVVKS